MGQALSQTPTAKARRRLADGDAVEYLVVGAGPAGLQAAYFLKKFGLDHAVVDAADGPASFFRKYPVGRQLISINKRHLPDLAPLDEAERADFALRHDWNSLLSDERAPLMRDFSEAYYPAADDLVRYLEAFEARHELEVVYGAKVLSVDRRAGGGFDVRIRARGAEVTIRAQIVLVAAGLAKQAPPDLPWAAAKHVDDWAGNKKSSTRLRWERMRALRPRFEHSTRAIDSSKHRPNRLRFDRARARQSLVGMSQLTQVDYGDFGSDPGAYAGLNVGVLGGGNSAFEVAGLLRDYAAQTYVIPRTDPEFAHESHYPGAARPGVAVDRARARRRRGPRRRRCGRGTSASSTSSTSSPWTRSSRRNTPTACSRPRSGTTTTSSRRGRNARRRAAAASTASSPRGTRLCGIQPLVWVVLTKLQNSLARSNRSRFG